MSQTKAQLLNPLSGEVSSGDIKANSVSIGKGANSVAGNTVLGESALDASVSGGENTAIGFECFNSKYSGADRNCNRS